MPLEDALTLVSNFNGKNISLSNFFSECDDALDSIEPNNEYNLIRFIKLDKLSGKAKRYVKVYENFGKFKSLSELKDILRWIFCTNKTEFQLLGELGSIFQEVNESVLDFAYRIKNIEGDIIQIFILNRKPIESELSYYKTNLEVNLIECFLRGLESKINIKLKGAFTKFDDIVNSANSIEREIK